MKINFVTIMSVLIVSLSVKSNTKNDPHLPVTHCYHWLNEGTHKYLSYKYKYASRNGGELTFYTTPASSNGAVAGPGLYCAKSPSGSYSYGDRVILVQFVDDVVLLDHSNGKKYCGLGGGRFTQDSGCQRKPWDVKFYAGGGIGNYAWYVIGNPQAVSSWTANDNRLVSDINTSKSLNGAAFSQHADRTLRAIQAEVAKYGSSTHFNQQGRMSIAQIIKNPKELSKIPPLTVIYRVHVASTKKIDQATKGRVYLEQFTRSFSDHLLEFTDYQAVLKKDLNIEQAFIKSLKQIDPNKLEGKNTSIFVIGLDRYLDPKDVKSDIVRNLWSHAFSGNGRLNSIISAGIKNDGVFAQYFDDSLPTPQEIVKNIKSHNLSQFLLLLDKYFSGSVVADAQKYSEEVLKTMLLNAPDKIAKTYDAISNPLLKKQMALLNVLKAELVSGLIGHNPISSGLLYERIASQLSVTEKQNFINALINLPLPDDGKISYLVLEDFKNGKISLPKFMSKDHFLNKVFEKSVGERGSKNPTNTFRLVFSGFYHFFNDLVSQADDANKSIVMKEASDYFYQIAFGLPPQFSESYSYISLQNASYFEGQMVYNDHPIETAYGKYNTGDANFDADFERILKYAYDGSLVLFLLNRMETEPNANHLINIMMDHFLSNDFDTHIATKEFSIANLEKKKWNNFIFNKKYTRDDDHRVPSDLCEVSNVIYRNRDKIYDEFTKAKADKIKDFGIKIYKNYCR